MPKKRIKKKDGLYWPMKKSTWPCNKHYYRWRRDKDNNVEFYKAVFLERYEAYNYLRSRKH